VTEEQTSTDSQLQRLKNAEGTPAWRAWYATVLEDREATKAEVLAMPLGDGEYQGAYLDEQGVCRWCDTQAVLLFRGPYRVRRSLWAWLLRRTPMFIAGVYEFESCDCFVPQREERGEADES
jgi:hypothetical protein